MGSSLEVKVQEDLPKNMNSESNTSNIDKKEIIRQDYHKLDDSQNQLINK